MSLNIHHRDSLPSIDHVPEHCHGDRPLSTSLTTAMETVYRPLSMSLNTAMETVYRPLSLSLNTAMETVYRPLSLSLNTAMETVYRPLSMSPNTAIESLLRLTEATSWTGAMHHSCRPTFRVYYGTTEGDKGAV